jgi:Chemotaxis response regulator containing a CheY-like receiver domain and a methylesterase domain
MLPERMLPSGGNPKTTVLIADDSAFMRALLIRMVESDDELSVIATAANGIEALTKINSLRPDVVTLDIDMPGMGGLEVLKRVMSDLPRPIIIVSAGFARRSESDHRGARARRFRLCRQKSQLRQRRCAESTGRTYWQD